MTDWPRAMLTAAALLILASTGASARNCADDTIDNVSSSGEIIKMASGHIYEIDSADTDDSSEWAESDDVLVCENGGGTVEIINTDENGEKVSAERLK